MHKLYQVFVRNGYKRRDVMRLIIQMLNAVVVADV